MHAFTDRNSIQGVDNKKAGRQRVRQACHQCRTKKYKCDGKQPACATCSASNQECHYGTSGKKRGLQSGYVKTIECLWGFVFEQIQESQGSVWELLDRFNPWERDPVTTKNDRAEELLDRWRRSGIPKHVEAVLKDHSNKIPLEKFRAGSGNSATECPKKRKWSECASYEGEAIVTQLPISAAQPRQFKSSPQGSMLYVDSTPELPHNCHALIQTYISSIHAWLPIIERHELFSYVYSYKDRDQVDLANKHKYSGKYAALWAALSLGAFHTQGSQNQVTEMMKQCYQFLDMADSQVVDVGLTQALLLLTVANIGLNNDLAARLMLAQAIVLTQNDNLSPLNGSNSRTEQKKGLLCFGCFVLDNFIGLKSSRKPQMSTEDLKSLVPCDESSMDEWEPYNYFARGSAVVDALGRPSYISSTANQTLGLLEIANDALFHRNTTPQLIERLETWRQNLPLHLQFDNGRLQRRRPPHIHNLHLVFSLMRIYVVSESREEPSTLETQLHLSEGSNGALAALSSVSSDFGLRALPPTTEGFLSLMLKLLKEQTAWSGCDGIIKSLDGFLEMVHNRSGDCSTTSSPAPCVGAPDTDEVSLEMPDLCHTSEEYLQDIFQDNSDDWMISLDAVNHFEQ